MRLRVFRRWRRAWLYKLCRFGVRVLSILSIGAWSDLGLSSFLVSLIVGLKVWAENVGCEGTLWSFRDEPGYL